MSRRILYARPRDLDEASQLVGALDTGTMLVAGGQELMPHINYGRLAPSVLVDISGIGELAGISIDADEVSIGALTVHADLNCDRTVRRRLPLLAEAAAQVGGGRQVRNRGTIGGNIVAMHPLYDIVPTLLALDAFVETCDADGVRRIRLAELIQTPGHGLGATAILSRVIVAPQSESGGWAYEKLKISDGAYGTANAAALVTLDNSERINAIKVVIGAVAELPLDASNLVQASIGEAWNERTAEFVERTCAEAVTEPLSDEQGEAAYRRAMAGVVARRAVAAAQRRARA
ncbi:MAG TPA: FAD binding domain-containing protein [Gammaproteobacteria bacterium]|nr:FAD binding domain-containing protein [Gammaproteobacteria bacterium]